MHIISLVNNTALHIGDYRGVPSIQPRNVDAIVESYTGHTPNERIVELGQRFSGFVLNPNVVISDERTEEVLEHTGSGGSLLIVTNHIKGVDPLTLSAVVGSTPAFEAVKHKIIIPAKPVIFRVPGIRKLADGMGAFPIIRRKDVEEEDGTITPENLSFQQKSATFAVETIIAQLINGGSATVLAEGERNKGNPLLVQEFEKGAALMYQKAKKINKYVAMLVAGIVYDANSNFRATVHIGGLFEPTGVNLTQKSESMRQEVQNSVDIAHKHGYRN